MPGTYEGGKRAAKANLEKHGPDFYKRIGRLGGRKGTTGGFASPKVDANGMTGQQRASHYGRIGGSNSKPFSRTSKHICVAHNCTARGKYMSRNGSRKCFAHYVAERRRPHVRKAVSASSAV